jgi:hypothetical protein
MAPRNAAALLASLACAIVLSACASKTPVINPAAQPLVGRWSQVFTFNDIRDEIAIDLRADATVEVKVRRHSGSGIDEYAGSGTWRVEEGHFVSDLAWSGPRDAVNHLVGRHRIVAVTEWQWVSEYRGGKEKLTAWRYPK